MWNKTVTFQFIKFFNHFRVPIFNSFSLLFLLV